MLLEKVTKFCYKFMADAEFALAHSEQRIPRS